MNPTMPFDDEITVDEVIYEINASYDNILKVLKLLEDERIHPLVRPMIGLRLLIGTDLEDSDYTFAEKVDLFTQITEMYIEFEKPKLDRRGEPMPSPKKDVNRVLDYEQDFEYIYASFMQAYGIDLIDERGKLHWNKFKALINGLPKNTKIVEIISIRGWKPSDDKKKAKCCNERITKSVQTKREGGRLIVSRKSTN